MSWLGLNWEQSLQSFCPQVCAIIMEGSGYILCKSMSYSQYLALRVCKALTTSPLRQFLQRKQLRASCKNKNNPLNTAGSHVPPSKIGSQKTGQCPRAEALQESVPKNSQISWPGQGFLRARLGWAEDICPALHITNYTSTSLILYLTN